MTDPASVPAGNPRDDGRLPALIVAHGQPSDPGPAEADLARLAAAVALHLRGRRLAAATLAAPGALEAALAGLTPRGGPLLIVPFFMTDGWFTRAELPRRLAVAGHARARILAPFGLWRATAQLAADTARAAALSRGWAPGGTTLILAAHGSARSREPAAATGRLAGRIATEAAFATVRAGFIEEPPHVADVARDAGVRAVCLPLFVALWGHARSDIPAALDRAGFAGLRLDPIGTLAAVPALIAGAITAACAATLSRDPQPPSIQRPFG